MEWYLRYVRRGHVRHDSKDRLYPFLCLCLDLGHDLCRWLFGRHSRLSTHYHSRQPERRLVHPEVISSRAPDLRPSTADRRRHHRFEWSRHRDGCLWMRVGEVPGQLNRPYCLAYFSSMVALLRRQKTLVAS